MKIIKVIFAVLVLAYIVSVCNLLTDDKPASVWIDYSYRGNRGKMMYVQHKVLSGGEKMFVIVGAYTTIFGVLVLYAHSIRQRMNQNRKIES